MPTIKLVGGISAKIKNEQAKQIAEMRWGRNGGKPTADPNSPLELPEVGVFQLKDVRAILNDDTAQQEAYIEQIEKNKQNFANCQSYRERIKKWTPLQKAERMLKTFCYLAYRARGNKGDTEVMFQDPLYSKLTKPIMEYFEKNQSEYYAPRELYQNLLPIQKINTPSVEGWKTFSEINN